MKWNDDAFTIRRYIGIGGLLASALGLALIMRFTVAYLGDTTTPRENTLNVGYADVSIVETFNEPSELQMLNQDITKEVKVQNKGTVPAFVRVYAEFSDSEIAKQAKVKYKGKKYSWADFKTKLDYAHPSDLNEDKDLVASNWRYVPENESNGLGGYFYYIQSLKEKDDNSTADITNPLFDHVVIDYNKYVADSNNANNSVPADSNIDRIVPLEMIIYSELIQVIDTGKSTVTTKTVDDNGSLVPAEAQEQDGGNGGTTEPGNPVESSRYGYNFSDDVYGNKEEWEDAWKRFLYKTGRTPTETVNPNTPGGDGP